MLQENNSCKPCANSFYFSQRTHHILPGKFCNASCYAIAVLVNPAPNASITPSGPTTFCQGNSVTLTSTTASSYLWSNSSSTQSINVTSSGNYVVTVTDANSCTASSSAVAVT